MVVVVVVVVVRECVGWVVSLGRLECPSTWMLRNATD